MPTQSGCTITHATVTLSNSNCYHHLKYISSSCHLVKNGECESQVEDDQFIRPFLPRFWPARLAQLYVAYFSSSRRWMETLQRPTYLICKERSLKKYPRLRYSQQTQKIAAISCWRKGGQGNTPPDQCWEEDGDRTMCSRLRSASDGSVLHYKASSTSHKGHR